jgi:hypothetical protein
MEDRYEHSPHAGADKPTASGQRKANDWTFGCVFMHRNLPSRGIFGIEGSLDMQVSKLKESIMAKNPIEMMEYHGKDVILWKVCPMVKRLACSTELSDKSSMNRS